MMYAINHLFALAIALVLIAIIYYVVRMCRPYETYMTPGVLKGMVIGGTFVIVALQWLAVALNLSKGLYQ